MFVCLSAVSYQLIGSHPPPNFLGSATTATTTNSMFDYRVHDDYNNDSRHKVKAIVVYFLPED
jgi:hypothetical protein